MKIYRMKLCLNCDELYDEDEWERCPGCGCRLNIPLWRYVKPLHGNNHSIERIDHAQRSDSVQTAVPMVVGEYLHLGNVLMSAYDFQERRREQFNQDRKRKSSENGIGTEKDRACKVPEQTLSWPQPTLDSCYCSDGVIGPGPSHISQGRRWFDAGHAVHGKVFGFASFKKRVAETIGKYLCRKPHPVVLLDPHERQSASSPDHVLGR